MACDRGIKGHINMRIRDPGSKAQDKGVPGNRGLQVPSLCEALQQSNRTIKCNPSMGSHVGLVVLCTWVSHDFSILSWG